MLDLAWGWGVGPCWSDTQSGTPCTATFSPKDVRFPSLYDEDWNPQRMSNVFNGFPEHDIA